MGLSVSTLLSSNDGNIKNGQTAIIKTIKLETILDKLQIDMNNVCLIKIDIEGGEKYVVPSLLDILNKYKPKLYISVHFCYLYKDDAFNIIRMLFEIYKGFYMHNGQKIIDLASFFEICNDAPVDILFME